MNASASPRCTTAIAKCTEMTRDDAQAILSAHISRGNTKVPYPIFNLCAARECPSRAAGLCLVADRCYADKAERIYPQVLPYRRRQAELWSLVTPAQFAAVVQILHDRARSPFPAFRFNEAGDVATQGDVDKLGDIAERLASFGVQAYTYTANDRLDWSGAARYLTVNGSGPHFAGVAGIGNRFVAAPRGAIPADATVCAGDCRRCRLCLTARGRTIWVALH